jgi:hypothetical protein
VWSVANFVDGLPIACHSELQWVRLGCFSMDEITSCIGRKASLCVLMTSSSRVTVDREQVAPDGCVD